jgi:competence protein ComEA
MNLKSISTTGIMLLLALFVTPLLLGSQPQQKVDLNAADQTRLESLPGIGPATAQRIIEYRTENGRFGTIEELMNVWGIGEKKYERLKDLITVTPQKPKEDESKKEKPKTPEPN